MKYHQRNNFPSKSKGCRCFKLNETEQAVFNKVPMLLEA